jgi:hypothetical protein
MKYISFLSILAALLGGCAIVPLEYGDHHDGYYQDRGYHRDDGYYQQRDHNRGYGNYQDERHRGGQANPFWDRGS